MLRAERESRKITHPHASYTSTGSLQCNLCEVPIKSDKAWSAHLHSTQHRLRSGREDDSARIRAASAPTSKKRKAVEFEEPPISERKKPKAEDAPSDTYPTPEEDEDQVAAAEVSQPIVAIQNIKSTSHQPTQDEAVELDDLERDLAALEQEAIAEEKISAYNAITTAPTISASAVTAEHEMDDNRGDATSKRSKREIELENDREDAAQALEDEFAEMEQLQERAKRLRDRREALRTQTSASKEPQKDRPVSAEADGSDGLTAGADVQNDDDDEESEDDAWTFGVL